MATPSRVVRTEALLMLLVANFFWGLSFPLIKAIVLVQQALVPSAGTWFLTTNVIAPRFIFASLLLLLWRPHEVWRVTRLEFKQGIALGVFASAGMLFQNDGLQFTAASTSAFLTQLYAILIPIYVGLRARRVPGGNVWLSCGLVLAGVAILGRFDWRELQLGRGEWETLLSSVFFMGQILWLEKPEFAANRVVKITFVMFVTQAVIFTVTTAWAAPDWSAIATTWMAPEWLALVGALTVFCTIGAYLIMNAWQPKISATEAGLIYCVEPIFGSAMALFLPAWISGWTGISYPNEQLTLHLLIGGGLITLANVLIQLRPPTRLAT